MRDALVLCYHGVSEEWPSDLAIQPAQLESQVSGLLARGYEPVTFTEAATGRSKGRFLSVTFDDSYCSVLRIAFPILAAMDVPGTVFVPTAFVGETEPHGWEGTSVWTQTPWVGEIREMGWEELAELADGGWEIGSHTRTHARLTQVGDQRLMTELRDSREEIAEALRLPCTSIAYPYGATDSRVARAAESAGYLAGGGLLPDRLHVRDPLLFPRVFGGRYQSDSVLYRRSRPSVRRLYGSGAWPWVAMAMSVKRRFARASPG